MTGAYQKRKGKSYLAWRVEQYTSWSGLPIMGRNELDISKAVERFPVTNIRLIAEFEHHEWLVLVRGDSALSNDISIIVVTIILKKRTVTNN